MGPGRRDLHVNIGAQASQRQLTGDQLIDDIRRGDSRNRWRHRDLHIAAPLGVISTLRTMPRSTTLMAGTSGSITSERRRQTACSLIAPGGAAAPISPTSSRRDRPGAETACRTGYAQDALYAARRARRTRRARLQAGRGSPRREPHRPARPRRRAGPARPRRGPRRSARDRPRSFEQLRREAPKHGESVGQPRMAFVRAVAQPQHPFGREAHMIGDFLQGFLGDRRQLRVF